MRYSEKNDGIAVNDGAVTVAHWAGAAVASADRIVKSKKRIIEMVWFLGYTLK